MKHANRWFVTLALAGLALDAGAVAAADAPTESATWQHHHATFNYVGFTSAYTCDGLEAQVRTLLAYFGARKQGMDVEAQGCPRGPNSLSHTALVTIDFAKALDLSVPQEHRALIRWKEAVSARPSISA